ncbi:myb-related transcription factor, partner of profilin-like isoform X1 [Pelobates cultripes]|uniref:Myb-related transcription factor, partner of profilin-like isoform X1 n=1 Tax=Pelobates cultripes TaxID=61616 RepID=A0AAD1TBG5_PELCU|nr:myb-related transcription factor, partner of profilin-like isoform X1 [Pelobates cultripes]
MSLLCECAAIDQQSFLLLDFKNECLTILSLKYSTTYQSMADKSNSCLPYNSTPKKKKERFSDHELHILADEVMANADKLFGKKASNVLGKATIWQQIAQKVNREDGMNRTVNDCKKRWSDYKRKIMQTLIKMKQREPGNMDTMEEMLTKRQFSVAKFFQMDLEIRKKETQPLHDELSFDGKTWTLDDQTLSISSIDSEEDFVPAPKKKSVSILLSSSGGDAQDQSISQSNEQVQSLEPNSKSHKSVPLEVSTNVKLTVPNPEGENSDAKLDKIITFQRQNNEILQSMQTCISTTLELQKKMNRLLKNNFKEIQKSMSLVKKTSKEHENLLDFRLKSLHSTLDDLKDTLHEKLRDKMTSDDSDEDLSLGQTTSKPSSNKRKEKQH